FRTGRFRSPCLVRAASGPDRRSMAMYDIDPVSMATQLATAYTQSLQAQINASKDAAQRISNALNTLRGALRAFDTALGSLSTGSGLRQFGAAFDRSDIGTASASSKAQPGTYSF